MPMWEIPIEINTTGRILMRGPTAEALIEILDKTSTNKIKNHIRDSISFTKIRKDSIRRIDEEADLSTADGSTDGLSGNQQTTVDCQGRGHNVDENHGEGEDEGTVVETDDGGLDEEGESVGETQSTEDPSQVA